MIIQSISLTLMSGSSKHVFAKLPKLQKEVQRNHSTTFILDLKQVFTLSERPKQRSITQSANLPKVSVLYYFQAFL